MTTNTTAIVDTISTGGMGASHTGLGAYEYGVSMRGNTRGVSTHREPFSYTPWGFPEHGGFPVSYTGGASAFNWWEENCCIFFKKISSPNAFYIFLPLFKHQTTPYNVLFFQKMKKYAFLFSFQTGTGNQWEGPHNNNKATCP